MKLKSHKFSPIHALIGLSVATLIALALSHWTALPFWAALLIVVGGMVMNGIIAQIEDDAPGGFNNPNPPKHENDVERDP